MQPVGLNYDNVIDFSGDRVTIMNYPVALPGKCTICGYGGGDGRRRFIDFGLSLDFFGAVNFCTDCMAEISRKIGFIPKEEFDMLRLENSELRSIIDDLRNVSDIRRDLADFGAALSKKFGVLEEIEHRNVDLSSERSDDTPRAESEPIEPSPERGPKNVHSNAKSKSKSIGL